MSKFYPLKIESIRNLTSDAVEIKFLLSEELKDEFIFEPGQYITVKHLINGEDIRRCYSLCSSAIEGDLAIGVKKIQGGKMSTFLVEDVNVGDIIDVMPPSGNFILEGSPNHIVAICAGSGITPIMSMMKSTSSNFTLIYGNKTIETSMYFEDLKKMNKNIYNVYSKEKVEGCFNSRISPAILNQINGVDSFLNADAFFLCGPGEMIDTVKSFLIEKSVNESRIHFERFTTSDNQENNLDSDNEEIISNVMVIVDGDEFEYTLSSEGDSILDSAIEQGADVPFSCKGAVCCTCRAKVIQGQAKMDQNFSLSEQEVEDGFILTCQAHPITKDILIDFDEI